MIPIPSNAEFAPHIAAIRHSLDAGFRFLHIPGEHEPIVAISATRERFGAVDTYTLRDRTEAVAARYRLEDYPDGDPIWQRLGEVCEVVTELLELPPHGSPGAPIRAVRAMSELWLPNSVR